MADIARKTKWVKENNGTVIAILVTIMLVIYYFFGNPEGVSIKSVPYTSTGSLEASVIYHEQSLYGDVVVFNYSRDTKALMLDGVLACTWNSSFNTATTHVHDMVTVLKEYAPQNADVLVIGLGCAGILKELNGESFNIDIVEINSRVVEAAEKYFIFPDNLNFNIIVDDGLHFLRNATKKYDAIIVDLCDITESNAHLYTKEFYELVQSKLKGEKSMLMQSLWVSREKDKNNIDQRVANTISEYFNYIYAISEERLNEQTLDVFNYFVTNKLIEDGEGKIKFVQWIPNARDGIITQKNSLKVAKQYVSILNEARKQVIDNFGFEIRLK